MKQSKMERSQKEFLHALKKKFSEETTSEQKIGPRVGLYKYSDPDHPTITLGGD